jgi:hypothetical protein
LDITIHAGEQFFALIHQAIRQAGKNPAYPAEVSALGHGSCAFGTISAFGQPTTTQFLLRKTARATFRHKPDSFEPVAE